MWLNSLRRRRQRIPERQRGFTLLETLIAFAILSIALTVLFRAFSNGMEASRRTEGWVDAIATARSLLDRVGGDIPLRQGDLSGQENGDLAWRLHIELAAEAQRAVTALPVALYQVDVSVELAKGTDFSLTSLRLGPRPGGGSTP
jgi:general secretion pathway protein I